MRAGSLESHVGWRRVCRQQYAHLERSDSRPIYRRTQRYEPFLAQSVYADCRTETWQRHGAHIEIERVRTIRTRQPHGHVK